MKAWVAEDQAQMASKTANHDVSRPSPPDDNPLVVDEPTFWMSRATERIADQKFSFFTSSLSASLPTTQSGLFVGGGAME